MSTSLAAKYKEKAQFHSKAASLAVISAEIKDAGLDIADAKWSLKPGVIDQQDLCLDGYSLNWFPATGRLRFKVHGGSTRFPKLKVSNIEKAYDLLSNKFS